MNGRVSGREATAIEWVDALMSRSVADVTLGCVAIATERLNSSALRSADCASGPGITQRADPSNDGVRTGSKRQLS